MKNPKIFLTTSRLPSSSLIKFTKDLKKIFLNSQKLSRGGFFLNSVIQKCLDQKGTDLILIHENRGEPDALIISHLPDGPTAFFNLKKITFSNKNWRIEISSLAPHIFIDKLNSQIGKRITKILCSLFCFPESRSKRIISFIGKENHIIFRHFLYQKRKIKKNCYDLHELGPSFEMFPFKITLGNLAEKHQKTEWIFSSFIKSHRKKCFLNNIDSIKTNFAKN